MYSIIVFEPMIEATHLSDDCGISDRDRHYKNPNYAVLIQRKRRHHHKVPALTVNFEAYVKK